MIRKTRELSTFLRLKVDYSINKHCLLCLKTGITGFLCKDCLADLPVSQSGCSICGEALAGALTDRFCGHCLHSRPAYQFCRSAFNYAFPVNQLIQRLKYKEQGYWASPLADAAWPVFQETFRNINKATLLPVPMHKSQYRQRRDNHAELIARRLGAWSGFSVENRLISKQQNTIRQAQLSGKARRINLSLAFALTDKTRIPGTPIIIIDDVATTGTTINVIAKLIKAHADNEVFGFTIAKRSLAN
jgi:ComF family protein